MKILKTPYYAIFVDIINFNINYSGGLIIKLPFVFKWLFKDKSFKKKDIPKKVAKLVASQNIDLKLVKIFKCQDVITDENLAKIIKTYNLNEFKDIDKYIALI